MFSPKVNVMDSHAVSVHETNVASLAEDSTISKAASSIISKAASSIAKETTETDNYMELFVHKELKIKFDPLDELLQETTQTVT